MLIAFAGLKGSGKDSAANVLIEEYGFTRVALADRVRDFTYAINPIVDVEIFGASEWTNDHELVRLQDLVDRHGWDHCKRNYPEVRRLMQAVGTEGGRNLFGENFWIDQLKNKHADLFDEDTRYVLTDARFLNEGKFVQDNGGTLIWITRPGLVSDGHASESTELKEVADYFVSNVSTQEELEEDIRFFAFMKDIAKVAP